MSSQVGLKWTLTPLATLWGHLPDPGGLDLLLYPHSVEAGDQAQPVQGVERDQRPLMKP